MQTPMLYLCKTCQGEVKPPNYLGRSWCPSCTTYEIPLAIEADDTPEGDTKYAGEDHSYVYITWRPRANSFEPGETADHRFMFIKRTDRLLKGRRAVSYKAKCSCKKWNNPNGFTNRRAAHAQWQGHMAEVEMQGSFGFNQ